MIGGRTFFDQPIKNDIKAYENIRKLKLVKKMITQGLFARLFISNNMIVIDLGKQKALDSDPNTMQQINLTGNLSGNNNRLIFFIIEEAKETILNFYKDLLKYHDFILF